MFQKPDVGSMIRDLSESRSLTDIDQQELSPRTEQEQLMKGIRQAMKEAKVTPENVWNLASKEEISTQSLKFAFYKLCPNLP